MIAPVGPGERNVNAVLLHGRRCPTSVPAGAQALSVHFNGPPLEDLTNDDLLGEARVAVDTYLGSAEPSFSYVFRYEHGLTIPVPGHYARMVKLRDTMPARIRLAGDYFAHAGIEAAVLAGQRAAADADRALVSAA
jgi:oxygen-dependent protoporphyrinogen oxidase